MATTRIFEVLAAQSERPFDLVGIGECSLDDVVRLEEQPPPGGKTTALGRDRLGGGQVASALFCAARLGLRCAYAGAVGNDPAGAEVLAGLEAGGVDVAAVRIFPGGATRTAIVLVAGPERTVIEHRDPRVRVDIQDMPRIADARVLHLDATDLPASLAAARVARRHGTLVSLDIEAPAKGDTVASRADDLDELLPLVDVCVAAEGFPSALTGETDLARALAALAERTGGLVVCTQGPRGATAFDGGVLLPSPGFAVDVVDTTACGDAFRGALLFALLRRQALAEAVVFANAVAALKCCDLGRRGCPTLAEVEAFLEA